VKDYPIRKQSGYICRINHLGLSGQKTTCGPDLNPEDSLNARVAPQGN